MVAATPASTAVAASCTLPTTPREPARHARKPSVSAAATRYRPMPSPRFRISVPPNTNAANATARTTSTAPMITPAATMAGQLWERRSSATPLPLVQHRVERSQGVAQPVGERPREPAVKRRGELGPFGLDPRDRFSRQAKDDCRGLGHHIRRPRGARVQGDLADHDPGPERPKAHAYAL